jgi:ATP-binding cassette subfamily B protein
MTKRNTPAIALIKRVIFQARPYWPHLAVLFVLNLLASPIALLKPVALKILIDNGFGSHPLPGVIRTLFPPGFAFTFQAVVLVAVAVAIGVALLDSLNGVANWLLNVYTGEKLVLEFRTRLFDHLQRLSVLFPRPQRHLRLPVPPPVGYRGHPDAADE